MLTDQINLRQTKKYHPGGMQLSKMIISIIPTVLTEAMFVHPQTELPQKKQIRKLF